MSDPLRPQLLSEYIGQPDLVARLRVLIDAARHRREAVPHVLLHGPPGLGKTTLAFIIANEIGSQCHVVIGPTLEKPPQVIAALAQLQPGDVLFIDEVHSANKAAMECLYPALEDGIVLAPIDTKTVAIKLPPFTLVAATTQPGVLDGPLRDRFGLPLALNFYRPEDMLIILRANAGKLGLDCEAGALELLAGRCRGTPRIANHLLRFARDLATVEMTRAAPLNGHPIRLSVDTARKALEMQGIDALGCSEQDRTYLRILTGTYGGGPVGADAMAMTMGIKSETLSAVVEPHLLRLGLIVRTQRGRKSTEAATAHLASVVSSQTS